MKTSGIFILILLLLPILTYAGEIYGTLIGNDGQPLTNQIVQIMQNDKVMGTAKTDTNGHFTVTIKDVGKFTLKVTGYKDASIEVFSANKSSRYNLQLKKVGDKWILKSL